MMSKYMFLFRGGDTPENDPRTDPEGFQRHLMAWKVWVDGLAGKGQLLGGDPLTFEGKVVSGRAKRVTDGPYMEGK